MSSIVLSDPADGLAPLGARTSAGTVMTNFVKTWRVKYIKDDAQLFLTNQVYWYTEIFLSRYQRGYQSSNQYHHKTLHVVTQKHKYNLLHLMLVRLIDLQINRSISTQQSIIMSKYWNNICRFSMDSTFRFFF